MVVDTGLPDARGSNIDLRDVASRDSRLLSICRCTRAENGVALAVFDAEWEISPLILVQYLGIDLCLDLAVPMRDARRQIRHVLRARNMLDHHPLAIRLQVQDPPHSPIFGERCVEILVEQPSHVA